MPATEPAPTDRAALIARLARRRLLGAAAGLVTSALMLGSLAWVIAGWMSLPRAWLPFCLAALALFAALELSVQKNARARLAPALELLADCAARLDRPTLGHLRGLPWIAGALDGRPLTLHIEWDGGERLRLGITVDHPPGLILRLVPAAAVDRPDRWLRRLRTRRRHRDLSDLPPSLIGLAPDPARGEALWARDPAFAAEAEALATRILPRAAVLDLHPEGIAWDGPIDAPALDADAALDIAAALARLAERAAAGCRAIDGFDPDGLDAPDASA